MRDALATFATAAGRAVCLGLLAAACLPAPAAIRSPGSADGQGSELWMSAYDPVSKTSYSLDMGVLMNDFFIAGQQDIGVQRFWIIDPTLDLGWGKFLAAAAVSDIRWAVFGADTVGNSNTGGKRLYTTVQQGTEGRLYNATDPTNVMANSALTGSLLNDSSGFGALVNTGLNATGTHNNPSDPTNQSDASVAINGSGFVDASVGSALYATAYFGNFVTNILSQTNVQLQATNAVGQSSWFYYLTPSSTSQLGKVRLDEFDNLGADGYFGFAKEDGTNRYLLSYTLPTYLSPREAATGVTVASNFARMAGIVSLSGAVGRGDSVLGLTEGFLRGLANPTRIASADVKALDTTAAFADAAVSAVPEPQSWVLMALGLGTVAALARRRQQNA